MKVKVGSRKLIKPRTPTPPNLKTHKLSFLDEGVPPKNVGVILIYPTSNPKQKSHLQQSLAKILPKFYPLAGRYIKNDHCVDCNDQGAEFVEAEAVEADLACLAAKIGAQELNDLLPRRSYQVDLESATDPLLSVQITEFKNSGGLVIGVSIWHKIFDGFSVGTFVSAWSGNPGPGLEICPTFDSPELFPRNQGYCPEIDLFFAARANRRPSNTALKRFSFNKEAITILRSRLSSPNYSRVRVVCAVVARALMGVDRARRGRSRATIIAQTVNMRGRIVPSPPEHSCGNLSMNAITRRIAANETNDIGIQELVDLLGDSLENTVAACAEMLCPGGDRFALLTGPTVNLIEELKSGDVNFILFSDWSKFGFYEADFGLGKPVGVGAMGAENSTLVMNSKEGDGMDAWVSLDCNDMAYLEKDEEINKFLTK